MILIILMLGLILFIVGFLAGATKPQRWTIGGIGLILLVSAATLMIGNDTQHWGMHQTTKTTTTSLTSAVKNDYVDLLLYEPIKHAKTEKVYVYRQASHTKVQHTATSLKTKNTVTTTAQSSAKLVTTTKHWEYKSGLWRWLYTWTGHHSALISTHNTFKLPKTWTTLSVMLVKQNG